MFTLLFGVLAYLGINAARQGQRWRAVGLLATALAGSLFEEYGPFGMMLIPALAVCLQRGKTIALLALAPFSAIANIAITLPYFSPLDVFAVSTAPTVYLASLNQVDILRLPKLFFYAYYPAHIYILHLIDLYLL